MTLKEMYDNAAAANNGEGFTGFTDDDGKEWIEQERWSLDWAWFRQEKGRADVALLAAGKALDAALKQVLTKDSIHYLRDAELVDQMHQALNRVVSVVGTPWREGK